ncbi:hypothetical protein U1Q18_028147 [Sarracenia purpurea var. burkii]
MDLKKLVRMATGAAGDGLLRGVFEGCISGGDTGIQRRPYHRNCGCALHDSRGHCPHASRCSHVSYPIRRSWSEGCLALMAPPPSGHASPYSSPATTATGLARTQSHFTLCDDE